MVYSSVPQTFKNVLKHINESPGDAFLSSPVHCSFLYTITQTPFCGYKHASALNVYLSAAENSPQRMYYFLLFP